MVTLQVLGSYALFGRNCPIGISSLVGLISPLHMKGHSLAVLYMMEAVVRCDDLLCISCWNSTVTGEYTRLHTHAYSWYWHHTLPIVKRSIMKV